MQDARALLFGSLSKATMPSTTKHCRCRGLRSNEFIVGGGSLGRRLQLAKSWPLRRGISLVKNYTPWHVLASLFAVLLVGCSGYAVLPAAAPLTGIPPADAVVADDFMRADTSPGTLSNASTGQVYTLYSPSSGPSLNLISPVGQLRNDAFIAPEGNTVYAAVVAPQPITRIGMRFQFKPGTGSEVANSVAMAISADDLYVSNMALHFWVSVDGWNLQTRSNDGAFISVCGATFISPLETNGTEYEADVRLLNNTAVVSVAGYTQTCVDPDAAKAIGPYVFWEHSYRLSRTATASAITATWAGLVDGN